MELTDIKGVGPTKAERLREAGIKSVQDLATIDLRKPLDVPVGRDVLKRAKQEARKALKAEGIPFEKAPYRQTTTTVAPTTRTATRSSTGTARPQTRTPAKPEPEGDAVVDFRSRKDPAPQPKRGILSRLFNRA